MSWRDSLLDASFKGASFKVAGSNYTVGRRTKLHQYANRDKPFLQDMGSDADSFTLEGYVVQNKDNLYDYFGERDKLINALKGRGPGTLVHPFLGIKRVGLEGKATIRESFGEGGIARFTMTFTEAGVRALPSVVTDFISKVDNAINDAFDLVGDYFFAGYNTVGAFMNILASEINGAVII